MARRAHAYPQVDPRADGQVNAAVVAAAGRASVGEALRLSRRRDAAVVAAGAAWILRDDLARASLLGLDDLAASALRRPLPAVESGAPEVAVRRLLAGGAPAVVVRDGRRTIGAVTRRASPATGPSLAALVRARLPAGLAAVIAAAQEVAAGGADRVFLAGGLVRDLLRGDPGLGDRDLDLVVEGDGLRVARLLAGALGVPPAGLVEHARFLTASLALPGGRRVDVATARTERYETPGALPRVLPATIGQDLGRRDFTVNAMAVEPGAGVFQLLDPFGGRAALRRRRLVILHPLSFVEDPTRLFRAARYGARLGLDLDPWSARAQALALRLAPYAALSGARLVAELELIAGEPTAAEALRRLLAAGVLRLLDPRLAPTPESAARLAALDGARAWARRHALHAAPLEVALLAVLGGQPPDVASGALRRLGLSGDRLARLEQALAAPPFPIAPVDRPSARAHRLRALADLGLVAEWLRGDDALRAQLDWFAGTARGLRPALSGDDLVRLGVPRGPAVARVLGALADARLDGTARDRAAEEALVRQLVGRGEER